MNGYWNSIRNGLVRAFSLKARGGHFDQLAGASNILDTFDDAEELLYFLRRRSMNGPAKDLVYRELVLAVQRGGEGQRLAQLLLLLGLWPGLTGLFHRRVASQLAAIAASTSRLKSVAPLETNANEADERGEEPMETTSADACASDVLVTFLSALVNVEMSLVTRVPATLIACTEAGLYQLQVTGAGWKSRTRPPATVEFLPVGLVETKDRTRAMPGTTMQELRIELGNILGLGVQRPLLPAGRMLRLPH